MEQPIDNITPDGLVLDGDALIRAALARALIERLPVDAQQDLPESLQTALHRLSSMEFSRDDSA